MLHSRRSFIKSAGTLAVASVVPFSDLLLHAQTQRRGAKDSRRQRILVLYDPAFPEGEIKLLSRETLQKALSDYDVSFVPAAELRRSLIPSGIDLFVNPYGSFFPQSEWNVMYEFLSAGGNWLNLGGVPFSVPLEKEAQGWRKEVSQSQYHKKLGITQAFPVSAEGLQFEKRAPWDSITIDTVFELYVRFASTKDFPGDDGSVGERDAQIDGLLYGVDAAMRKLAAPFVQIDRMQGKFSGGRWVLANFKGSLPAQAVTSLAELALRGAMDCSVKTSFACYYEGEAPSVTIALRRPKGEVESFVHNDCTVEVVDESGKAISKSTVKLDGSGTLATGVIEAAKLSSGKFAPGFYAVHAKCACVSPVTGMTFAVNASTGFWIEHKQLLKGGSPLGVNDTYITKGGKPYPVTGTTYMGSDVHRKFLFEPNPYTWRDDFRDMKSAGINMVRTGIWTGWKNIMFDTGAPSEGVLRAMDAFVHTARAADIPVIFTFFAFLPETWGGLNAYLDPRSVNSQKEFILAFVNRYRMVNDLAWDLINEPSFCNPKHLWECRPNYDTFESVAWSAWLKDRYPFPTDEERTAHLQEIYRTTPDKVYVLPKLEEFDDVNIFDESRPMKIIDYRLFAQEMFAKWTRDMSEVIRSAGNTQLITVGQDEGGTGESPANHFYPEAVDFTSIHNWWLNDDLVWDSVMTSVAGKPNVVEETGVMFYEKMDGSAWRTEEEARNLLERKLAVAFGTACAGFIEWVWNTNPYMMSDNESAIGLHRADGTAKPERDVVERYAGFFAKNKEHFIGKKENEVWMVIPHSSQFSTRNIASDATKRCVRVMSHFHSTPITGVSEYSLQKSGKPPKLIIVPAMRAFRESAWQTLLGLVDGGSTLLVTGIFDADEHFLPTDRGKTLGFTLSARPVAQEEFLAINGKEYRLSYRGDKIQRLETAIIQGVSPSADGVHQIQVIPRGKGRIIWSPLPVELSDPPQANIDLYDLAVKSAGITLPLTVEKANPSILILPVIFELTMLLVFVSENERDTEVHLTASESKAPLTVKLPAQRSAMILVRRGDGKVIAQM